MGTTNRAEETKGQLREKALNFLNEDKQNIMKLIEATKNRPYKEETLEEFFTNAKIEILPSLVAAYSLGLQYRQSEIDELTKEKSLFIEKYTKSCNEVQKLEKVNDELTKDKELLDLKLNALDKLFKEQTKEVERLRKGIDWTRAEYIKCVNDSDEITEKLEELLTTH